MSDPQAGEPAMREGWRLPYERKRNRKPARGFRFRRPVEGLLSNSEATARYADESEEARAEEGKGKRFRNGVRDGA